jgi:hypothetical protein
MHLTMPRQHFISNPCLVITNTLVISSHYGYTAPRSRRRTYILIRGTTRLHLYARSYRREYYRPLRFSNLIPESHYVWLIASPVLSRTKLMHRLWENRFEEETASGRINLRWTLSSAHDEVRRKGPCIWNHFRRWTKHLSCDHGLDSGR